MLHCSYNYSGNEASYVLQFTQLIEAIQTIEITKAVDTIQAIEATQDIKSTKFRNNASYRMYMYMSSGQIRVFRLIIRT